MAKNIDFMGAIFPDVPSVRLPQQGGGLVSFDDTTDANATAADIAQGKTAYVNGEKLTGTASGGGGASNYVTGTFTTQSTNGVQEVTIPYTGTGYPIAVIVEIEGGPYNPDSDWYNFIGRYRVGFVSFVKTITNEAPTYGSGANNEGQVALIYKSSTSAATTYSAQGNGHFNLYASTPSSTTSQIYAAIKMVSDKKLAVYVSTGSAGFKTDEVYRYHIIYSS